MCDKLLDFKKVFDFRLYPDVNEFIFILAREDWKFCEVKTYRLSRKDVFKHSDCFKAFLYDAVNFDYVFQQLGDSVFNAIFYPRLKYKGVIENG